MDMLEPSSLTADEGMNMPELYLTADEAMDMEPCLSLTIDNGAVAQSADGSLICLLQLPSGQHNLEQEELDEAAEFFDQASDDDDGDVAYQSSDPEFGYPTEEIVQGDNYFNDVVMLSLLAQRLEVDFETLLGRVRVSVEAHSDGGDGLLDPFDVAVAGLEKHAFHATAEGRDDSECGVVTGCAICLEEFEDGKEVTVMPCSRGHEFHPGCITEWLGKSNTCPLCRYALPTYRHHG